MIRTAQHDADIQSKSARIGKACVLLGMTGFDVVRVSYDSQRMFTAVVAKKVERR